MTEEVTVWTPLRVSDEELSKFLALQEGLPAHLHEHVIEWMVDAMEPVSYYDISCQVLVDFQLVTRIPLGIKAGQTESGEYIARFLRGCSQDVLGVACEFVEYPTLVDSTSGIDHWPDTTTLLLGAAEPRGPRCSASRICANVTAAGLYDAQCLRRPAPDLQNR